ncbi:MAG TPA: uroporphyrinogen decarboxylase family protein [Spirochaetia bacterium]|nr:uroporphyrinogen decarboxylase family protein [Spirochaetia bacterium]
MARLDKRQRVEAALAGAPVDRTPVAAWAHLLPDETTGPGLVRASLKWFRDYDWDWLKVNPRATLFAEGFGIGFDLGTYYGVLPRQTVPTRAFTLDDLKPADPGKGSWSEHLEVLRTLKAGLEGAPFVQTLFSPASVLGFVVGRPTAATQLGVADNHANTLLTLVRTQPKVVHQALEVITQGLEKLAKASLEAGADGLFFAITKLAREGALTRAEFEEFGKPYDLRVLKAVSGAKFNLLHLCGPKVYWNQALDYPVSALNWASVGQGNPSVAEARKTTGLALVGGLDEVDLIQRGTPAQVEAAGRRAVEEAGTAKYLLAPGCCVEPDAPVENLKALRRSVGA